MNDNIINTETMKKKTVLLLNISHNELGLIRALHQLGYYILATGNNALLPGKEFVDEYVPLDYSNKDLILELAKSRHIDAICPCVNDFGVITAAYVAEKMNLPGHDTYENTLILHHKDKFKEFTKKYNIQSPISTSFDSISSAKEWVANISEYQIIVKPVDLTGGKGCSRANNIEEALLAIDKAYSCSRVKHIVIEPYIEGTQHACCAFLVNQKVRAICSNNEYSFTNPYKVEVDTFPADYFDEIQDFLIGEIEKIASILKLKDGIFHAQYILQNRKPYIFEVMRRVLGNLYMIPASKLTGIDWEYWEAKAKCGLSVDNMPYINEQKGFWAYRCVMGTKDGVIESIRIPESVQKYIFDKYEMLKPGDVVENWQNSQLAFYFMQFNTAKEMRKIMVDEFREIYPIYK